MFADSGPSSVTPFSGLEPLPAEGVVVFSTPTPSPSASTTPSLVRIVIKSEEIDQTGIGVQPDNLFSLQLMLTEKGIDLLGQWNARNDSAALYLAIDGTMISLTPLQAVADDTIELGGLSFDSIYALAAALGYDQEALAALSRANPRYAVPGMGFNSPVASWKITSANGQYIGDQLDEILEILNNRFDARFGGQVSARRVQSALQASSPSDIDRRELSRLVATPGQVAVFSSRQRPLKDAPLPEGSAAVLTQEHIQFASLEDSGRFTLVIDLNDQGTEALVRYQAQAFKAPLYLALDGMVAAAQSFIISGDSRLEMDDLSNPDALFLFAVIDNDPLPVGLVLAPAAANLQDEEQPLTWKVASNDPTFEGLDDVFIILNNRAGLLYHNDVSVERAQSSLRVISAPYIDSSQVLRLVSTLGKTILFTSSEAPRFGAALPASASTILDQSQIVSASVENPSNPALALGLDEEGRRQIEAFQRQFPGQSLFLALDGRCAAETALTINSPSRLTLAGLPPEEVLFLCAVLDNDPLPTSLSVSPITLSRADDSMLRGFNDVWLVKTVDDSDLASEDWEDIRSILTYRIETMLKDATSIEFEGGRLMVIPDLHTDPADLQLLVTRRGEVSLFTAPFAPAAQQPLPQGARQLLTQDEISAVNLDQEGQSAAVKIKLNIEGARLVRDVFQSHSSSRLYIAIDGQVVSSQPLTTDGSSTLFLEGLSLREASFLVAILDNDILPMALALEPVALDSYEQFIPEPNQTWYAEPADSASDLSDSQLDQSLTILNQRSADLLNRLVTFEAHDTWGILVHFESPDTPINLDTLEQIVNHAGRLSIFSASNPPVAGSMLSLMAQTHLAREHILSAEAGGAPNAAVLKLGLNHQGKTALASIQSKPLFLALDDEVLSAQPLSRVNEGELHLDGLEFEQARLLSVLINRGSLPVPLQINMEED